MQDILEVLPFAWLLRIEQFEKLLDEAVGDEDLECLDVSSFVDDELQEELVDGLEVRPGGIHKYFILNKRCATSSIPTPSPGGPAFLRTGSGRKMFFSIISMTRSMCGMITDTTQFWSVR